MPPESAVWPNPVVKRHRNLPCPELIAGTAYLLLSLFPCWTLRSVSCCGGSDKAYRHELAIIAAASLGLLGTRNQRDVAVLGPVTAFQRKSEESRAGIFGKRNGNTAHHFTSCKHAHLPRKRVQTAFPALEGLVRSRERGAPDRERG